MIIIIKIIITIIKLSNSNHHQKKTERKLRKTQLFYSRRFDVKSSSVYLQIQTAKYLYSKPKICIEMNKGRFCNTIASVALVHTSIQSDKRMQTKEILSSRISKQTKPQSCPETSKANSRLVRAKGGFL